MDIKITINTDNAAFEDNPAEILRILRSVAEKFEPGWGRLAEGKLRDSNGNIIGSVEVTD